MFRLALPRLALVPAAALAAPLDACTLLTAGEIDRVAASRVEGDNLEKIYRSSSKKVDTVGDAGFRQPADKQPVVFSTPTNRNEVDTAILARLVESRLAK